MTKNIFEELKKIEYNYLIGLITYKQKKELETNLKHSEILKEEVFNNLSSSKKKIIIKQKNQKSIYMNSYNLNNIYI